MTQLLQNWYNTRYMTSSSDFVQLLVVQKGIDFRDNCGECDCKMKRSRITINATSKGIPRQVEIYAVSSENEESYIVLILSDYRLSLISGGLEAGGYIFLTLSGQSLACLYIILCLIWIHIHCILRCLYNAIVAAPDIYAHLHDHVTRSTVCQSVWRCRIISHIMSNDRCVMRVQRVNI